LVDDGRDFYPYVQGSSRRKHRKEALNFFDGGYQHGQLATELGYIPLPESVVSMVKSEWSNDIKASGKAVY
jgi:phosphate transport system substrate-binding protein